MEFVVGVSSSIVAAVLLAIATYMAPRLLVKAGRGSRDISGDWEYWNYEQNRAKEFSEVPRTGVIRIRQWGARVRLTFTIERRRDGERFSTGGERKYVARGRWQHDELVATARDPSVRHRTGALVLHWRSGGIVGRTVYVEGDRFQAGRTANALDWVCVHGVRLERMAAGSR